MEFCKEMGYTQRSNGIAWAFSRMEPYETEARRDIAEMNKDECISTISRMGLTEVRSVKGILSTLKLYARWCKKNLYLARFPEGFSGWCQGIFV